MKSSTQIIPSRPGMALPMTIIAVAGLTLLLVGLLTVLTLERKTARSYSDAARADLAVESGLAVALATITEIAKLDDTLVFRVDDPSAPTVPDNARPLGYREQFFTYGALFENGKWRGLPLFSASPEVSLGSRRIDSGTLSTAISAYVADAQTKQLGRITKQDQNIPRAKWVEVPGNPGDSKDYKIRYAFWIEDLGGRIDGRLAGALPRAKGNSAEEIQLFSFFGETKGGVEDALIAKQKDLRTPGSTRTVLSEAEAAKIEPYIYYSFPPATSSTRRPPSLIPQGFGYAEAGSEKADLNPLVEAGNVEGITERISSNLPDFVNRRGGFLTGQDYLKTIAANIIDYADVDTNATTGSDYRGVDSYPFVNELYDRYERLSSPANQVKIKVDTYAEFWNPTNQSMSGFMRFKNVNRMKIRIPFVGDPVFGDVIYNIPSFSMEANEYKVLLVGSKTYTFGPLPGTISSVSFPETTPDNNFELYWRDSNATGGGLNLVDTARGIVDRQASGLGSSGADAIRWKGNGSVVFDTAQGQFGDPRLTFYTTGKNFSNTYATNSSWGGRKKKGSSVPSTAREVRSSDWPDGGSDAPLAVTPGSDSVTPNTTGLSNGNAYPAAAAAMNPSIISNQGRYSSIFELGNIFDPVQWDKLDHKTSAPVAASTAGGGTTLAIGRPEYRAMDIEGRRGAQLLDIFKVDPPSLTTPNTDLSRININTAPREVLRALVAGVVLEEDLANTNIKPPSDKQIGDVFADMVIAHRNKTPFRSVSDLGNIRKNPLTARNYNDPLDGPFFGNLNQYPAAAPTSTWKDVGREELFRKIAGRVNFGSKSFRIVVAGEVRDAVSNQIIGKSTREFHYTVEPERDATTGKADPNQPVRLLKHYEKSTQ